MTLNPVGNPVRQAVNSREWGTSYAGALGVWGGEGSMAQTGILPDVRTAGLEACRKCPVRQVARGRIAAPITAPVAALFPQANQLTGLSSFHPERGRLTESTIPVAANSRCELARRLCNS